MNKAVLTYLVPTLLSLTSISSIAAESKTYTYGDAAVTNLIAAGAEAGMAFVVGNSTKLITTQLLPNSDIMPRALTDPDVKSIVRKISASPFNTFGLGTLGGSEITAEIDVAQRTRMLAIKNAKTAAAAYHTNPSTSVNDIRLSPGGAAADKKMMEVVRNTAPEFATEKWNVRSATGVDSFWNLNPSDDLKNLEARLIELKNAGVSFRTLTFRGILPRATGAVAGTIQVLLVGGAVSNSANAAIYGAMAVTGENQEWVSRRCGSTRVMSVKESCEKAGVAEALLDTSEYMFYKFTPDEK